ncbi:MAG TPA: hypothetical protein VF897_03585 [Roseiflexaceae bacterium]
MLDVAAALVLRRQQRPLVGRKRNRASAMSDEHPVERLRQWTLLGKHRQQQHARQRRAAGQMIEPGADHRLGRRAIDERRAERRIGMGPADQHRHAVAPARDGSREQAEQPRRRGARPDQAGASVATEHRLRRQRKRRLVEHVGLERAGSKRAPFVGDGGQVGERPPLDAEDGFDRSVHGRVRR